MPRRTTRLAIPVAAAAIGLSLLQAPGASPTASAATAYPAQCPWMDTTRNADQRAQLLLKASTLDQTLRWLVEQPANYPGVNEFSGVTYAAQLPCTPQVQYTDGPDSVRVTEHVTNFPAQISLAASWNTDLARTKGAAQGDEAFRTGRNVVLGPGVASGRTPQSGRTPEYFGEDSLLSGTLAAAHINGLQKGDPDQPVMAVLKHYVANEQEDAREWSSSNLDERTLREVYDLPFEVALDKSEPGGIMCSYNQVNGIYACENPLLNENLKRQLGFDGYVVSDWNAVHSTGDSLAAGLDQELNRPIYYTPDNVKSALSAGEITRGQIDEAALRVVRAYIKAGLFDHPLPAQPENDVTSDAHRAVARQIATEGSVLLKNQDRILPLSSKAKKIAVIGPTASNTPTDGVSTRTVCFQANAWGLDCRDAVAPLDAIKERAAKTGATVVYDNGSDAASAAAAARSADVAIVFGYNVMGELVDAPGLALDGNGDQLISAVADANPNTVAVLETGSAVLMPWQNKVKGILESWYPGQEQGNAIARLLWGDDNPSGRLPMTFPKSLADLPASSPEQYPGTHPDGNPIRQVDYSEGLKVGYKWYDEEGIEPLYPFGYGLSYTTYSYDNLHAKLRKGAGGAKDRIEVSFTVTNTGRRTGTETSQVYLTLPSSSGEPGKRLVSFRQTELKPGEHRRITLTVDGGSADHPLSIWDTGQGTWTVPKGKFTVQVGSSSRDLQIRGSVVLP
ncbi:glycoside hydrolase family 3 C-terminal domain-containing protein [Streptomyces sp. NPDC127033]|uniref:beta-glucosidase n=1 Tax=Streptomyces sp. NPDC127033 TaxID=3347110 RepID=UPI00364C89C9